jgi:putative DNA methylase
MGISGADLVIAAVGAGLRAFTRFERVEYANGEEVPAERFLAEVEGVVLETLLERIFSAPRSGLSAVDSSSRFYVLWRFTYRAVEVEAGEAIVFAYPQDVELSGPRSLTVGPRALLTKKGNKYCLRDFAERGADEKLGLPNETTLTPPLIDVLHRALWLMEHHPASLPDFLDQARPNTDHLRLVAQALAGPALQGGGPRTSRSTEQAALATMLANWRNLVEENLFRQRS